MALSTPTVLISTPFSGNAASMVSGSILPSDDAFLVVAATGSGHSGSSPNYSASTTLSNVGTWTQYTVGFSHQGGSRFGRISIFVAKVTGAPGTGTVTITSDGTNIREGVIHVSELSGEDGTTPVAQNATNTGTASTLTATLASTPATDSMVFGACVSMTDTDGISPGTGFTELAETESSATTNRARLQIQYDLDNADTTCDWSDLASDSNAGVAIEIAVAEEAAGDIAGSTAGVATVAGALAGLGALAGAIAGVAAAVADLAGLGRLSGTAAGQASVAGSLAGSGEIAGSAAGQADVAGSLVADGDLAGAADGVAAAAGSLVGTGELGGTAAGSATVSGDLTAGEVGDMSGAAAGSAVVSGALIGDGRLAGTAAGVATVEAQLAGMVELSGAAAGSSSATGILVGSGALAGAVAGETTLSGVLIADGRLVGTAQGLALVSGALAGAGVEIDGPTFVTLESDGRVLAMVLVSGMTTATVAAGRTYVDVDG